MQSWHELSEQAIVFWLTCAMQMLSCWARCNGRFCENLHCLLTPLAPEITQAHWHQIYNSAEVSIGHGIRGLGCWFITRHVQRARWCISKKQGGYNLNSYHWHWGPKRRFDFEASCMHGGIRLQRQLIWTHLI